MQASSKVWPKVRSSLPVENKATRKRRNTVTCSMPKDAINPRSPGRSVRPAAKARPPCAKSSPHLRRFSPRRITPGLMCTLPPSTRHNSCGTTVSAPAGITAPVMMRKHWRPLSASRGVCPAYRVPVTSSVNSALSVSHAASKAPSKANPSIAELSCAGTLMGEMTWAASVLPSAPSRGTHSVCVMAAMDA